jgi:U3 small nucleolar RNA-associated protein 4
LHVDVLFQSKGHLNPKRIRDFSSTLQAHLPESNSTSTGAVAFQFTPDSSKLVMSTAISSYVIVVDLTGEKPRVLRSFDHHRLHDSVIRNRVVKGRKTDGDVEMEDVSADPIEESSEEDQEDPSAPALVSILRISVSPDGQWLATSDDHARTHVFNLDSIQVSDLYRLQFGCC